MPRLPLILLSALTLTLGGCFMSSDALIKPASADYPWSNLRAQQFKWSDGKWQAEGYVSLRREGPNYRLEDERTRDVTRFLAHQIGDNRYVVQLQDTSGSGDAAYTYALLVAEGKRVYQYSFDDPSKRCQIPGIDAAALKLKRYEDGCGVPSLASLVQIFDALQKAQPKFEIMYELQP